MKKKAVFTLITCSVAALFLICVLAVGLSENGFGIGTLFHESKEGWSKSEGQSREYTWDPAETEVTGLKIDWVNGTIDVKVGSGDVIRITEQSAYGELKEDHQLKLSSSDGILRIKWGRDFLFFNIFENRRKDLTVGGGGHGGTFLLQYLRTDHGFRLYSRRNERLFHLR